MIVEDSFVDVFAGGCDAGIRYDERLEQDMIAVPIGPRVQRFATAAAPAYLAAHGRPRTPARPARPQVPARAVRERRHAAVGVRARRRGRAHRSARRRWSCNPARRATSSSDAAIAGLGVVALFEDWLRPAIDEGTLEPVLEAWWQTFSGPFLYFPSRRLMPAPLRAFVDFIKA